MFSIALKIVGVIQIALGLAYLLVPDLFLMKMGHSLPAADLHYPLGMLASRFIAYGAGLWIISRNPEKHVLWIRLMAFIQSIDLVVGIFYTITGVVPVSLSAFPMFNAVWIGLLFVFWKPASRASLETGCA